MLKRRSSDLCCILVLATLFCTISHSYGWDKVPIWSPLASKIRKGPFKISEVNAGCGILQYRLLRLSGGTDSGLPEVEDAKYAEREAMWQKWREEWEYCTGEPIAPWLSGLRSS